MSVICTLVSKGTWARTRETSSLALVSFYSCALYERLSSSDFLPIRSTMIPRELMAGFVCISVSLGEQGPLMTLGIFSEPQLQNIAAGLEA